MDVIRCDLCDPATRQHLSEALLDALCRAATWEAIIAMYNPLQALKGLEVIALEKARVALPRLVRASLDSKQGSDGDASATHVHAEAEARGDAGYERAMMMAGAPSASSSSTAATLSAEPASNSATQFGASSNSWGDGSNASTTAGAVAPPEASRHALISGGELTDLKHRLDAFVAASRDSGNWFSRGGGDLSRSSLNPPGEKFLAAKERIEKEEVWTLKDRNAFAEVLIKHSDSKGMAHCLATFFLPEECEQHRNIDCPFRPILCKNVGCHEVRKTIAA